MLTAKAFQDTRHKLLTAKEQCGMKISYLQKINRACLYSYLIRYQTLILPVHIKSQLSYAAITEKFCIRELYNLRKNSKKARLKKSTRKMRMVSRSWQNCLEGPQNCPQGRGFCLFFLLRGRNFAKMFCPGAGNLTTLKKFPGGMLVLGID